MCPDPFTSNTNSLVLAVLASATTTYTNESGQTARWNTNTANIRAVGSTKPGAALVTNSWTGASRQYYAATAVSINPAMPLPSPPRRSPRPRHSARIL